MSEVRRGKRVRILLKEKVDYRLTCNQNVPKVSFLLCAAYTQSLSVSRLFLSLISTTLVSLILYY